jgi:hypothetical protein
MMRFSRRQPGMLRRATAALAVAAALPFLIADSPARFAAVQTAQAVGFHCATPQFVCQIPPSLLGSICFCGSFQGVVVP